MKKKLKLIQLLLPLIVLFAILFPVIHSYQHKHNDAKQYTKHHTSEQNEFKLQNHSNEHCAICHFKFSPIAAFSFQCFEFYKSVKIAVFTSFYSEGYSHFFKGSLFALRAPPASFY
ncbi:hypothetical protein [Flavobacterium hercynium]|uniref:DUF2946 domain-containing protein n=1 Tax=Flavobacterium hercynium TaxID=387094 RepID=A0A226GVH1_9FLAO|nr:hypothetical protein [Flavobacterium hercynium]OXA86032.1 hypothetical protein B0A66_18375 [Flavobacterium hercynium]